MRTKKEQRARHSQPHQGFCIGFLIGLRMIQNPKAMPHVAIWFAVRLQDFRCCEPAT
jgi:hypothetical protein